VVNSNYDILIVGAGPAGISTWLHLHKYTPELASKTLVIDKAVFPRDKLCGGALGGWSKQVLEHLDIEIKSPFVWIDTIECRFGGEIYALNEPKFFRVINRREFDDELVQTAIKRGLKINLKSEFHLAPAIEIFKLVNPDIDNEFDEQKIVIDFSPMNEGLQGYLWHFPCIKNNQPSMNHGIGTFRISSSSSSSMMKTIFTKDLKKRNIKDDVSMWSGHPIRFLSEKDRISNSNVILVGDASGIECATAGGIHLAPFEYSDFSFNDYNRRIQSHLVGKWIFKCNKLGNEMYTGKMNPLDAAKKIFGARK